jgi:hypothetical protein
MGGLHPAALSRVDDALEEFAASILKVNIPLRSSIETPVPRKRWKVSALLHGANCARQDQH